MQPKTRPIPAEIQQGLRAVFRAIELITIGPGQPGYRGKLDALQEVNKLQDSLLAHFKTDKV